MSKRCIQCLSPIKGEGIYRERFGWFCNEGHALTYLVKKNREALEKIKKEN